MKIVMPNAFETPWVTLEVNDVPLSLCNDLGRPNLEMISLNSFFLITSSAFSVQVGKSLIYPVNVYIMINRYLYPWEIGIWVKSTCQSSPGYVPRCWTGWASWGLWAPWGLFNLQVGQEKTTCLIVVWRPVPLKDLSSNLWRAFSPKWVAACKELSNFHWKFPGRIKSPSFWNHPVWSQKPSLLALRVSPSVYEGVSGKIVYGTQVTTPIRSLFCNATLLTAWSTDWFPLATSELPFWCPLQWETEILAGRWTASKSLRIWSSHLIGDPRVVKWPLSFQIASCACSTRKAYLESV